MDPQPIEKPLPARDGVFTHDGVSQDFKLRRKTTLWKNWYWIDTPSGVAVAQASELAWDDEPKEA